ncbi:MAG: peptidoglycan DD-metalloendopeptidase family protein [Flavobacteriales bacterium]|tara:strand:+ start:153 stop:1058 length:906 start_codon:yes stop_codon:yes gene_type:complete
MKKTILFIQLISLTSLFSQNVEMVFSKDIFISEDLSGTIKLFDNGVPTFTPFDKEVTDKHFDQIKSQMNADTMKIFNENWSSTKLYPYKKIDLSIMEDTLIFRFKTSSFYCTPTDHLYSAFGPRRGRQHKGIDTDLNIGDTLRTVFDGKIRYANYVSGFGNLVIIRHYNGLETYYAHQSKILVEPGDLLSAGDVIGLGGETGNALGPHLHFEIRYMDNAFDPEKVIDLENQCLKVTELQLTKKDFEWKKQWRERKYHKVKSGNTLGYIAITYNTSVKKILKINKGLKSTSILQIGQKIRVR